MEYLGVAIVGFGTVGSGVVEILLERRKDFARQLGVDIELLHVCDLDITTDRGVGVDRDILTTDFEEILNDERVGCVVHLVGGIAVERDLMLKSIARGKHVVTANKALLAEDGITVYKAAADAGVSVSYEASCAGGIPIIAALRDSFIGNRIQSIMGIVNGTCNYILTRMTVDGASYDDALAEAQQKGYAEADPTMDVEGGDSAHKIVIMAQLAFGRRFAFDDVYCEGIQNLETRDLAYADELGYVVKLLAIAKERDKRYELRVHPTMLPSDHLLARVNGSFNAVFVHGNAVGETLHYGRGAGRMPTASAVVADIVDVALGRAQIAFSRIRKLPHVSEEGDMIPMGNLVSRYYLRFHVVDKPGVLAAISSILGKNDISIQSMIQKEQSPGKPVPLVMTTHEAAEARLVAAVAEIDELDATKEKSVWIRVEDEGTT